MEDERTGEQFQWRNALDELNVLPGEPVTDKEAAWDKLQMRLRQKPRKRGVLLYWTAAAAILLLVMTVWWMHGKQPHEQLTAGKQPLHPAVMQAEPVRPVRRRDLATGPHPAQKGSPGVEVKIKSGLHAAGAMPQPAAVIITQQLPDLPVPAIAVQTGPAADTQHALVTLPLPKKLRIVRLNELGAPAETPLAGTAGAPGGQMKLSTTDDFSKFYITRNNSDDILKVKLSSN